MTRKRTDAERDKTERSKAYHHGDLRAALIAAAGEMLERDGPEAISLRAVARAAGVSQSAPYNHFQSKEDLLATVAALGFDALAASQKRASNTAHPGEARITALGLDYIAFALAHPQLYRLMYGAGVSDWCAHPAVMEAKGASFRPVQDALKEHLGRHSTCADVETAAIAGWALVHGLSMLLLDRSLDPAKKAGGGSDGLVRRVVTSFAAGLKRD